MSIVRAGLLFVTIIAVASFFGFTKMNPFSNYFELKGVFQNAMNLKKSTSEVRIAGVEIGRVKSIDPMGSNSTGALVTMEIYKSGLPIHEDAELKIRPQLFLEGNYFVDLRPGSPSAPKLSDGATIPIQQTAIPVQFGDLLTALQADTRRNLRTALSEYALKGLSFGGAKGFRDSIEYWEPAFKNASLVNDALLGTRPGDLQRVIGGQQQTLAALGDNTEALQDVITDLNVTASAFAREDDALQAAIPALRDVLTAGRPALRSLSSSLPSVRRFARDALPGVRSSRPTLDALAPFVAQLRGLMQPSELRGLVDDLEPTVPALARMNRRLPPILNENRALSACANNVLIPFAESPIPNPDRAEGGDADESPDNNGSNSNDDQLVMRQLPRSLVGLSGESRLSDANSPYFRVNFSGGSQGAFLNNTSQGDTFAAVPQEIAGTRPALPSTRWDFRPDVPCETQEPPNLEAPLGSRPDPVDLPQPQIPSAQLLELLGPDSEVPDLLGGFFSAADREKFAETMKRELEKNGYEPTEDGKGARRKRATSAARAPASSAGPPAAKARPPAPKGRPPASKDGAPAPSEALSWLTRPPTGGERP